MGFLENQPAAALLLLTINLVAVSNGQCFPAMITKEFDGTALLLLAAMVPNNMLHCCHTLSIWDSKGTCYSLKQLLNSDGSFL